LETAKSGVTVNAVCPGYTETELVDQAIAAIVAKTGRGTEAVRAELVSTNPMGRLVTPDEVAATVAYLCLLSSAAITGQSLVVAGGELMP
jgi:NAD(P)-dependent dehydrogenase (short-subunit alcohol dehydrogenase family)